MQNYPPLIAVLGPTAVGKTAISFQLASDFDGEIVSADSRQIYRGLDIGTDKIEALRRDSVPHHLLDVVEPDAFFTLAQYQRAAFNAIDDIHQRGGIAFLVGGTGLYVRAVLEGLGIPEAPPNETIRGELYDFWETQGAQALHKRLQGLDPDAAAKIDPRNV
ncbi:MAG: tRNA (adenosine(37)-N6)-dimethylallyltransferase MiaA, partial [Chloroflexota bacterium]|nr:tRNA (adenosine(37)-N6)-dimethylallyltransferase MiaA [Chloroflexota bacterium]